jgi:hypothetical protein
VKTVFGDTAYFLALVSARDNLHGQAVALSRNPPGVLLTTEWVLTEVGDGLSAPTVRDRFVRLLALLRSRPDVRIIPATSDLFERGCALFSQRPDKEWSLTDCTSFVVMTEYGVEGALTSDEHFVQAGFRRLMQP